MGKVWDAVKSLGGKLLSGSDQEGNSLSGNVASSVIDKKVETKDPKIPKDSDLLSAQLESEVRSKYSSRISEEANKIISGIEKGSNSSSSIISSLSLSPSINDKIVLPNNLPDSTVVNYQITSTSDLLGRSTPEGICKIVEMLSELDSEIKRSSRIQESLLRLESAIANNESGMYAELSDKLKSAISERKNIDKYNTTLSKSAVPDSKIDAKKSRKTKRESDEDEGSSEFSKLGLLGRVALVMAGTDFITNLGRKKSDASATGINQEYDTTNSIINGIHEVSPDAGNIALKTVSGASKGGIKSIFNGSAKNAAKVTGNTIKRKGLFRGIKAAGNIVESGTNLVTSGGKVSNTVLRDSSGKFVSRKLVESGGLKSTTKLGSEAAEVATKAGAKEGSKFISSALSKVAGILPKKLRNGVLGKFLSKVGKPLTAALGKLLGKAGAKLVPGVGGALAAYTGIKDAISKFRSGDKLGGCISLLGAVLGVASIIALPIPPLSTALSALSISTDVFNIARDIWNEVAAVQSSKEVEALLDNAKKEGFADPESEDDPLNQVVKSFGDSPTAKQEVEKNKILKRIVDLQKEKHDLEQKGIENLNQAELDRLGAIEQEIKGQVDEAKKWEKYTDQTAANASKGVESEEYVPPVDYYNEKPNIDLAVETARNQTEDRSLVPETNKSDLNASPTTSTGYCARYVRHAMTKGGMIPPGVSGNAKDWKNILPNYGFSKMPADTIPQKGDISVEDATRSHKYGHIAMYDGNQWISDFKQKGRLIHSDGVNGKLYLFRKESNPANLSAEASDISTSDEHRINYPTSTNPIQNVEGVGGDPTPDAVSKVGLSNYTPKLARAIVPTSVDLGGSTLCNEAVPVPKFPEETSDAKSSGKGGDTNSINENNNSSTTVIKGGDSVINRGGDTYNDNRQYITNIISDNAAASELL